MSRLLVFPLVLLLACPLIAAEHTPAEVFKSRIEPIFRSPNPSSCVQCHLAGVDLKDYILPDAEKTYRSLRDQGLIDVAIPEKSKIIKLIDMGSVPKGPASIHETNRLAEREAFLAWIKACAADPRLRASPKLEVAEQAQPKPVEVIRHARKDRVLESFEKNVWAWRFRCMNCHTEGTPQSEKSRKEYGDRVIWTKKAGAAATMEYLIDSQLIDTKQPEKSLLLRKPLGESHKGGVKFVVGDEAYKGFRTWIEDVAAIRGNGYATAANLPAADTGPERFSTELWFKLTSLPPGWGEKLLQVRFFAWDERKRRWEDSPIATSDRLAAKAGLWQHTLTLLADRGSERARLWRTGTPTMPAGRYLAKLSLDREGKLAKDWKAKLTEADAVGQIEFTANWRPGYGAMTAADGKLPKK